MEALRQTIVEHWMRISLKEKEYSLDVIPIMIAFANDDILNLSQNKLSQKMLEKYGDNSPKPERVILSDKLTKINKRGKEQTRILLLTNKAIYNQKPKYLQKCQRRIVLEKLSSITVSTTSDEFVLHIPEEYDYRYKHKNKDYIISVLLETYKHCKGKELPINTTCTSEVTTTCKGGLPRLPTREQRLRRYQELIGKDQYDDEIADAKQAKVTGQLIQSKENISANDFEFLKLLNRNSFSKVIQVRKKDNGKIFAMKILKKKALISQQRVFHSCGSEARWRQQSVIHPFLMQLRYAFQTDSKLYYVFEYDADSELYFHLKKKRRFSEDEAKFFVAEVALVLGHLHSLDIIYRNLKPENLLITKEGHIALKDVDLALLATPNIVIDQNSNDYMGTPEYLAPEVVMNLGHGKPVDWWSFGILLYELTVGIVPFYSQNINEMYRKIQEAPLLFPPNLSNECKDIIQKLLERDPKQRLGSSTNHVIDIQQHQFFKNIDWDKLYRKDIDPPYKPTIKRIDDLSSFDELFLKEAVIDCHIAAPSLSGNMDGFDGFTYVPKINNNNNNNSTIGLSVGGAKDVDNFRKCIEDGIMPSIDSITYNGLLYEYYFDTKTRKHVIEEKKNDEFDDEESMLFYPTYCYAKTKKLILDSNNNNNNKQNANEYEYYLSVGLNSNIKQKDFKRKQLNLVILIDKSGSMYSSFQNENILSSSKMESAKKATLSIIKHLKSNDRIGIVSFDSNANIIQKLDFIKDIDMDLLNENIFKIEADNGTNFEKGYNKAIELYHDVLSNDNNNNNEYDQRIMILTDAQPNEGMTDSRSLLKMVQKHAKNIDYPIYTTFIGVGLDFNSSLIQRISQTKGCNYYSVHSTKDFDDRMNEEFEFMVTPLVFNVCLKLKCEGNSCQIGKVYGSNIDKENEIIKNGEITKIHTLFPSKKSNSNKGETKGGIQLIKLLKNKSNHEIDQIDDDNINVELEVSFQDRNGKKYKNTQNVTFKSPKQTKHNDMIEMDDDEEIELNDNFNFYDNTGIRKAILLCKYVELIKKWIQYQSNNNNNHGTSSLPMSDDYKNMFSVFATHFKKEMKKCNDDTLQKEMDIINKLIN